MNKYVVYPCVSDLDAEEGAVVVSDDLDADFFAVYRLTEEGEVLLRDFPSRETAEFYVTRLERAH